MSLTLKIVGISLLVIFLAYVLSLFDLYTQLGRYKAYWQKNNEKAPAQNEILYVALGDSTAQGIGATRPQKNYTSIIARQLEADNKQPVRLINLSKSGAKVQDAIDEQIPAMNKLNIDSKTVVTIEIGANDMINFDENKFRTGMDELMGKLPDQTIISDIPYFGQSRFKNREPNVVKANQIMSELSKKHNFELANLHDRMRSNGGVKTFAPDWFHPSNTAYRENWAPAFLERINN